MIPALFTLGGLVLVGLYLLDRAHSNNSEGAKQLACVLIGVGAVALVLALVDLM